MNIETITRRFMGEDGQWHLFCRACGKHRPENEFYNKKNSPFGKDSRCKLHFNKKEKDDDTSTNYLKLNPLTENDFKEAKQLLIRLGYDFDSDVSIHQQFMLKHNL
jgi:hypothetical protein